MNVTDALYEVIGVVYYVKKANITAMVSFVTKKGSFVPSVFKHPFNSLTLRSEIDTHE